MSATNKMESSLTGMWVSFFTSAGIPSDVAAMYALTFTENRIQNDMLLDLNKEYLQDMGITRMGDVIAILRHAKQVHEIAARDRVLNTTTTVTKVPVAAITGRSTVTQPSSPASRIVEHYTRNPQALDAPQSPQLKRKSIQLSENSMDDVNVKKARLLRFGAAPAVPKEGTFNKQTVFSRLGGNEAPTQSTTASAKPIYARLGSKSEFESPAMPLHKDALKYEGILKPAAVTKKMVTITTSKNNVRKINCTMRADEEPVSVKDKLAKPKSVKFSNQVQYKEIEAIPKQPVKKTAPAESFVQHRKVAPGQKVVEQKGAQIFNKPERRLSMPEVSVKDRLGNKNVNNLTITRNVFNRLGV